MSADTEPTGSTAADVIPRTLTRSQVLALLALLAGGTGAGTLGTVFVAPLVDDALDEHARDPHAHVAEFSDLENIERRLAAVEDKVDEQAEQLIRTSADLKAALIMLER